MAALNKRAPSRRKLVLIGLIILSVILITVDYSSDAEGSPLRKGLLEVVRPVQSAVGAVTRPIGRFFSGVFSAGDLSRDNERLQEENERLRAERVDVAKYERELEELRRLTNVVNAKSYDFLTARVVGEPATNFDETITIDAGTDDRVSDGNPVRTGQGLVGRVLDATSTQSKVLLLTDPLSGVGVRDVRNGITGKLQGHGSGKPLTLDFVDASADVAVGDEIATSGFEGSRFPPNLPIGRVATVDLDRSGLVKAITVEPYADGTRRDFVTVLLWTPST
ncbi:MAG: rod shape-determining protein MreC [Acidimicrobiia bacterium]|nr:rod shape-determining protein MreC [Acidimicrobiia bacterium]